MAVQVHKLPLWLKKSTIQYFIGILRGYLDSLESPRDVGKDGFSLEKDNLGL